MTTNATDVLPTTATEDPTARARRVVVGMDDAPVSVAALHFAAREAAYRGGDVLAVHAWHYPMAWGYPMAWPEQASPGSYIRTELQAQIDTALAERAAAGEPYVAINGEVVEGVNVVALTAAAHGTALLVLGARHHNRLLGSVSQACTNHPPCPVVIVPDPAAAA